ncbi:regulatory protein GemA [Phyllobacterium leguminum]|uniref:Uncharacterized protein DUF1018 n=1 Tax=Phyllobacterium leguminum TaxID=314237 RepID=A0A318SY88_9HYPH|nr:regulatory protein GemA [Phyllobacterium leguminum]PYE86891.1 uncharacterized protein DUF1018 [Phyllobacterium leguminum]
MSTIRAIKTAIRELGIEEDDERDLYERLTGIRHASSMTPKQQEIVLGELRRLGFKPYSKGTRKTLDGPYAKKLQALWIGACNLGLFHRRDDDAIISFAKRQTGIDHVRWVRYPDDAQKVIEALKGKMAHDAGVDWSTDKNQRPWQKAPGYRIARAQWAILLKAGSVAGELESWLDAHGFPQPPFMDKSEWQKVMNSLGVKVRALKKEKR